MDYLRLEDNTGDLRLEDGTGSLLLESVVLPGVDQAVTGTTRASAAQLFAPTVAISTTATLLSDTFTGADGTSLAAHTMDVGPGWTVANGVLQLLSNRASGANGSSSVASVAVADAGVADGVFSMEFTLPPSVSGNYSCGLALRATGWDDGWMLVLENDNVGTAGSDYIGIYERTAGVQTLRAGGPTGGGYLPSVGGTTVTLTGTLAGDVITVTCGSLSFSYTSTVRNHETHHGFYLFFISGSYLPIPADNFNGTGASTGGADQAVSGATLAAAAALFAPTVTPGTVTIVSATIGSGAQVFAATVTPAPVTLLGSTVATSAALFAPSVAPGAVTITTATVATGAQPFAPTVAPGAVTIVGSTIAATAALFAPSLAVGPVTLLGVTLASTAVLFPPTVTAIVLGSIGAATISTTAQLFPPTLIGGLAIILAPTITLSAQLFPPALTVGAVTILGATIPSSAPLFAPALLPGAVTILAATRISSAQLFPPLLTVGPATVVTATRPSTTQLFPPTVVRAVVPTIGVPFLASTTTLHPPLVHPPVSFPLFLTGATIGSLAQLFPPSVAGRPPRVTACQHTPDDLIGSDRWREA